VDALEQRLKFDFELMTAHTKQMQEVIDEFKQQQTMAQEEYGQLESEHLETETMLASGQQENARLLRASLDVKLQIANNKVIADRAEASLTQQRDRLQAEVAKQQEELLAQRHVIREQENTMAVKTLEATAATEKADSLAAQLAILAKETAQLTKSTGATQRLLRA
jgi:chromosome segregation ATPase